jgi:hypothetical protein
VVSSAAQLTRVIFRRFTCSSGWQIGSWCPSSSRATTFRKKDSCQLRKVVRLLPANFFRLLPACCTARYPHSKIYPEDAWSWLRGPFLSVISGESYFVRPQQDSQLCARAPRPSGWSYPDFGFVGDGTRVIAPVYMRQLRVPKGTCPAKLSDPQVWLRFLSRLVAPATRLTMVLSLAQGCAMTWHDYDSFVDLQQAGEFREQHSMTLHAVYLIAGFQHHVMLCFSLRTETGSFGLGQQFTSSSFQQLPGFLHWGTHAYFKPSGFIQQLLSNPFHPVKVSVLDCLMDPWHRL